MAPYRKPPITEAVIEFRIEPALKRAVLDKLAERFSERYPLGPQETFSVNVEVGLEQPKVSQHVQGYKLIAADGAGILTVGPNTLGTSKLAPYEGWEAFVSTARENWDLWKRTAGWQKVSRVGIRYINRIDIPNPSNSPVTISDYLNVYARLPATDTPPITNFALNAVGPLGKDDFVVILNASSAPSPLLNTISFIVDLDISREKDLPQNEDEMWSLINRVRAYKNDIFEACVTDRARVLFR